MIFASMFLALASPLPDASYYYFCPITNTVFANQVIQGEIIGPSGTVKILRAEDPAFIQEAIVERNALIIYPTPSYLTNATESAVLKGTRFAILNAAGERYISSRSLSDAPNVVYVSTTTNGLPYECLVGTNGFERPSPKWNGALHFNLQGYPAFAPIHDFYASIAGADRLIVFREPSFLYPGFGVSSGLSTCTKNMTEIDRYSNGTGNDTTSNWTETVSAQLPTLAYLYNASWNCSMNPDGEYAYSLRGNEINDDWGGLILDTNIPYDYFYGGKKTVGVDQISAYVKMRIDYLENRRTSSAFSKTITTNIIVKLSGYVGSKGPGHVRVFVSNPELVSKSESTLRGLGVTWPFCDDFLSDYFPLPQPGDSGVIWEISAVLNMRIVEWLASIDLTLRTHID